MCLGGVGEYRCLFVTIFGMRFGGHANFSLPVTVWTTARPSQDTADMVSIQVRIEWPGCGKEGDRIGGVL